MVCHRLCRRKRVIFRLQNLGPHRPGGRDRLPVTGRSPPEEWVGPVLDWTLGSLVRRLWRWRGERGPLFHQKVRCVHPKGLLRKKTYCFGTRTGDGLSLLTPDTTLPSVVQTRGVPTVVGTDLVHPRMSLVTSPRSFPWGGGCSRGVWTLVRTLTWHV